MIKSKSSPKKSSKRSSGYDLTPTEAVDEQTEVENTQGRLKRLRIDQDSEDYDS